MNGPVTLRTDDATRPVKCPPRRVPIAMQTKFRYEFDGFIDLKVIIPVTEPTEWCSQISVQTKKSGRLRICTDPRPLNEVLQRETYPLHTIDDLLAELANAKKGSFYIAQYPVHWTAQSDLHFLPPLADLFIPTLTRLLREAF